MPQVDFLPFATSGSAAVEDQTSYAADPTRSNGFGIGIADENIANKAWRQGASMAAGLANAIANTITQDVLDNGDIGTLTAQILAMITKLIAGARVRFHLLAFAANLTFDASLYDTFEVTLAGDVTASTLANHTSPGQVITLIIRQDGSGGHNFTPPADLPFDTPIDTTPNKSTVQSFVTRSDNSMQPLGGQTVQ